MTVTQPTALANYFAYYGAIQHQEALFGIPSEGPGLPHTLA